MRPIVRGAAAALAVPALVLPALVAASAPASAAVDPGPAAAGGAWLAGKVPANGVFVTSGEYDGTPYSYDDYGLSIDVGLALDAAGGHDAELGRIVDGLETNLDAYTAPGFGTVLAAGATAKSLAFLQDVDGDADVQADLLADLESTVVTEGVNAGRIRDQLDPEDEFAADYANVFGQAPAVQALDHAGSPLADSATDFLLEQQCSRGFFRQDFSAADAADQSCDAGNGKPNVDATALAITSLQSQVDEGKVADAVADAAAWLLDQQRPNGGFASNAELSTLNANSTGAAALALHLAGKNRAAAHAAAWLRAHQLTNVANCVYYDAGDTGAVVYDDAGLTAAQDGPMDSDLGQQAVRATADAVPGLQTAQTGAGDPHAIFTAEYVKAGGFKTVGASAAPGEAVCAMLGEQSVLDYGDVDGDVELRVRIPAKTATSKVRVANADGVFDTVRINALGAKKLTVMLKKRVAAGAKQTVKVTGLAPGESGQVEITWPSGPGGSSGSGTFSQANGKGVLRTTFKVPARVAGKATVKVQGAFATRSARSTFTVTR